MENQATIQRNNKSDSFLNTHTALPEWTFHIAHRVTKLALFLTNIDREGQRLLACSYEPAVTTSLTTGLYFS
jgi:hypothetical protein